MDKKKIALLALSVCMIAILAVGGSLAYLTDQDSQTNTFTAGQVGIKLDETKVAEDPTTGNLLTTGERTEENQEYHLHPNMIVDKDPTIWVDENSERSYLGAIVTVKGEELAAGEDPDEYSLYALFDLAGTADMLDIHKLAHGDEDTMIADKDGAWSTYGYADLEVFENANYAIHQVADKANNTWTFYIFVKNAQNAGDTVTLFDHLIIPADFDNDDMEILKGMSIDVKAYAVQAAGFELKDKNGELLSDEGCYNAMTDAFEDWNFANNFTTQDGQDVDKI